MSDIFVAGDCELTAEHRPQLGQDALRLLLQILETPNAVLSLAHLTDSERQAVEVLAACGLLVEDGFSPIAPSPDDHDDVPVALEWDAETPSYGVFSPFSGWVGVETKDLGRYCTDFEALRASICRKFHELVPPLLPELAPGVLWDLGMATVMPGTDQVSLWFSRRLSDPAVWREFRAAVSRRPANVPRIILTSTLADRFLDQMQGHDRIVPLGDVVDQEGAVDPKRLALQISPAPATASGQPLFLSPDGTTLVIHGRERVHFRGDKQIHVIKRLVAGHRMDEWLRAADLLDAADSQATSLRTLFGEEKWAVLSQYLKPRNQRWRFEV